MDIPIGSAVSDTEINIARDFSRYPSGRVVLDGPNSGERFRDQFLIPALNSSERIVIVLDGVRGYPSSFTEEAFGGLVRAGFDKEDLLRRIRISFASEAYCGYKDDILDAIKQASPP
ncbi:STAS-like domain-containing protein [Paracoccus sp. (in: a-proteobacteria)]|uniref:STAS-like domain-containing protein n=1 Tax=Paracoccus sp. TaxID=267 RepID=UPI003A522D7D